jgi:hypothetical protein
MWLSQLATCKTSPRQETMTRYAAGAGTAHTETHTKIIHSFDDIGKILYS